MGELGSEVIINGVRYSVDHERQIIKRFNDNTKMWVKVSFAAEDSDSVVDTLLDMLADEHIRQSINK